MFLLCLHIFHLLLQPCQIPYKHQPLRFFRFGFLRPVHLRRRSRRQSNGPAAESQPPPPPPPEADLHVLADHASRLVPVQPPQELRFSVAALAGAGEPPERTAVGDDEFAGEDRRCRGRAREASPGGADPAIVAPAAPARPIPAPAKQALRHVHGGGRFVNAVNRRGWWRIRRKRLRSDGFAGSSERT